MPLPSSSTWMATAPASRQPRMRMVVSGGAYLAALSSRLNSTCSSSTASTDTIGRSAATSSIHGVLGQDLAGAPQRAADDLAHVVRCRIGDDGAGLELGHVQQVGDEPVQPLGLVDDGGEQIRPGGVVQRRRHVAQRARRTENGGQRRLEVVRDRGEERRAQALGLHRALDPVDVLDQAHALDCQRGLIDQGMQQAPLVRRQQRAGSVAVDAEDADRAAARCASA